MGEADVSAWNENIYLPSPAGIGSPAAVTEHAPGNICWIIPRGQELIVVCRTTDLPLLSRSRYQQYDRIVVLREPRHALVPSGGRLSANEYAVGLGEFLFKFNKGTDALTLAF
ncbi:uncharacterized protein LOC128550283 [Mercenaria mercenaria]|uniref:uncharacterized protein LOC128550283 n=1 Tax=Mercenaria mercenaria TaxID=6596 RepID=UPI00234F1C34|nr:uncharacterized protein LOC128550283 [Mercenaria mercenaria]